MVHDLENIYREYSKPVYYYLLSLCCDPALSEELTQETMFRAVMNIHSFRGDCRLLVWLCQIAKNLYYEHRKRSRRTVPLEEATAAAAVNLVDRLEDRETASQILQHLHELEDPYKEVFTLHALGNIPLKQISKLFGKSDSWARVTFYRAKAMIVEKMEEG